MFKAFSLTQASNYAIALSSVLAIFGHTVAPEALVTTFQTLMQLVALLGAVVSFINRARVGDLHLGGSRRE